MEDFIKSLTAEERIALGRYLIDAIEEQQNFDSALRQAIGKLLLDTFPGYNSDGFFEYVSVTARQVVEGTYESLDDIRQEFELLIEEEQDEDKARGEIMKFEISFGSGITHVVSAKSMAGAKRIASRALAFGAGDVYVKDTQSDECWERQFWQAGNRFGWNTWIRA
jgi:hypothetical protein